jgi:hypothetical protein
MSRDLVADLIARVFVVPKIARSVARANRFAPIRSIPFRFRSREGGFGEDFQKNFSPRFFRDRVCDSAQARHQCRKKINSAADYPRAQSHARNPQFTRVF